MQIESNVQGTEAAGVIGDPVLLQVLATAQRFVAWYGEFLARTASAEGDAEAAAAVGDTAGDEGGSPAGSEMDLASQMLASSEDLSRHLQHAVFDLMAAVHSMNKHCATTPARVAIARQARVSLSGAAVH